MGDYCSTTNQWSGITCDTYGYITELNLNGMFLVGTIPTEVGHLTKLDGLNLGFNPSETPKPVDTTTYCQMTAGVRGTTGTGLSGTLPTEIGQLTNLEAFDVSYTYISGVVPAEFNSLSSLTSFKINKERKYCNKNGGTTCNADNSITS